MTNYPHGPLQKAVTESDDHTRRRKEERAAVLRGVWQRRALILARMRKRHRRTGNKGTCPQEVGPRQRAA